MLSYTLEIFAICDASSLYFLGEGDDKINTGFYRFIYWRHRAIFSVDSCPLISSVPSSRSYLESSALLILEGQCVFR